ncbi:carbon-nitrogen hydrolase family protein [Thermotoga sp. SG1]|uniref:carbon-nitrogen hydrolase family protein n=1 Tax=Thermotoga sp. SG1 TaxID=126739 RepID=UPI0026C8C9C5
MLPTIGGFEENLNKVERFVEEAVSNGVDVIVFPELTISGYTWDEKTLAKGVRFFEEVARKKLLKLSREGQIAIAVGTPRLVLGKLRNSLVIFKKKREILFYDKTHLFRGEKDVFEPGEYFLVFSYGGVVFGTLICYEIGFPEIARVLTLRGSKVILSSFAFGKERGHTYDIATRARAVENGVFIVASSMCGKGFVEFVGRTRIVAPSGKVLRELETDEGMIVEDIDPDIVYHYRYNEEGDSHAYLKNYRVNMYSLQKGRL